MKQILTLSWIPLVLALAGCYFDKESELYPATGCVTADVRYNTVIRPILDANCNSAGCHAGQNPGGGYDLTTYAGVLITVNNGALIGSITHATGYSPMPKNGTQLPDCQITQIKNWVDAGAPNN